MYRYSIRTAFVLLTLIAVALAFISAEVRREARELQLADRVSQLNGQAGIGRGRLGFRHIEYIIVPDCSVDDELLLQFAQCKQLNSLQLLGCEVRGDLAVLSDCQRLTTVNLSGCGGELRGLPSLSAAATLRTLWVIDTDRAFPQPVCLEFGSNLRVLRLVNLTLDGTTLEAVAKCERLEALELSGVEVKDEDIRVLRSLQNLRWLQVANNQLTDNAVGHLADMQTLTHLNVIGNDMTQAAQESLISRMRACKVITE